MSTSLHLIAPSLSNRFLFCSVLFFLENQVSEPWCRFFFSLAGLSHSKQRKSSLRNFLSLTSKKFHFCILAACIAARLGLDFGAKITNTVLSAGLPHIHSQVGRRWGDEKTFSRVDALKPVEAFFSLTFILRWGGGGQKTNVSRNRTLRRRMFSARHN